MIDIEDKIIRTNFFFNMMEQCSSQCIRRTFYAVMIGVSPIIFCLVFIGLARLILYRLEIAYYRRQKITGRRLSLSSYQSGRLTLSYTPVSKAELQRIIQGEYQTRPVHDPTTTLNVRRAPKFIKSILPRREPATPSTSILANLVIRRDAIDANAIADVITPMDTPFQPTFSIVNEQERRRPSVITIKRESIETTTLKPQTATIIKNTNLTDSGECEPITNDALMAATTTKTLTTTVVVEEFLEFHSVSSLPCELTALTTLVENDNEQNSEINTTQDN